MLLRCWLHDCITVCIAVFSYCICHMNAAHLTPHEPNPLLRHSPTVFEHSRSWAFEFASCDTVIVRQQQEIRFDSIRFDGWCAYSTAITITITSSSVVLYCILLDCMLRKHWLTVARPFLVCLFGAISCAGSSSNILYVCPSLLEQATATVYGALHVKTTTYLFGFSFDLILIC